MSHLVSMAKGYPASTPTFAELLVTYMQRNRVDHAELAKQIEISRDTLSRWMKGTVTHPRQRSDVLRCAEYLDLSDTERDEFLLVAGFMPPSTTQISMPSSSIPIVTSIDRSHFVIGPPITEPRQFFGREQILRRIFDVWRCMPLQHIAVVGLKRSGKTSLLHYLRHIIDTPKEELRAGQRNNWLIPGYQWVFVDFQDPRMCYQESLLRYILNELDLPLPEPCDFIGFMEIIDQYLEIPTLILLDEINVGLTSEHLDEQFWWGMRSLGSNHAGGKIGFLITSHYPPEELAFSHSTPSPFFNIFGHVFNLEAFNESEALDFIKNSPIPFVQSEVDWMLETSGKWPSLLQILCHSRLTALDEGDSSESWKKEGLRRITPYRYLLEQ